MILLKYINLLNLFPIQSSHIFSFFVFSRFVRLGLVFLGCLMGSQLPCCWAASRVATSIYLSASPLSHHPRRKECSAHFEAL
ncbi:hypothetical protein Hanom_Chr08g00696961 [Helianthus anomalus]